MDTSSPSILHKTNQYKSIVYIQNAEKINRTEQNRNKTEKLHEFVAEEYKDYFFNNLYFNK